MDEEDGEMPDLAEFEVSYVGLLIVMFRGLELKSRFVRFAPLAFCDDGVRCFAGGRRGGRPRRQGAE